MGLNSYGQLGDGSTTDRLTPIGWKRPESSRCPSDTIPPFAEDKRKRLNGPKYSGILGDGTSIDRNNHSNYSLGVIDLSTEIPGKEACSFRKGDGSLWE